MPMLSCRRSGGRNDREWLARVHAFLWQDNHKLSMTPVAVQGDLEAAIEHYHKALGLRPEDTFTTEMLTAALAEAAEAEDAAAL